jgi:hypothetical protein
LFLCYFKLKLSIGDLGKGLGSFVPTFPLSDYGAGLQTGVVLVRKD